MVNRMQMLVPAWYVVFQGLLGILQLGIGLVMVAGYRRAGIWAGRSRDEVVE